MRKKLWLSILFVSLVSITFAQDREVNVLFYNVENLFDLIDEPLKNDDEFTPKSEKKWNQRRYNRKLEGLARVIGSTGRQELPEIIGLAEVENVYVIRDLIAQESLNTAGYKIIHEESPDERGIDVALVYRPEAFTVLDHEAIPVELTRDSTDTTRDILYVGGKVDQETWHIFVNHWPSRYGGRVESEWKRLRAAVTLRKRVDLLIAADPEAKILIMGDFNDEPTNRSIMYVLLANNKLKNYDAHELYNLVYDKHNTTTTGTYNYRGEWNMLDQIIVSRAFLTDTKGYHTKPDRVHIMKEDFMMYKVKETGQLIPNRTYGGTEYYGGISDHLPIYVTIRK